MSEPTAAVATTVKVGTTTGVAPARGVWRTLRRRPLFWVCTAVLVLLLALAVAPQAFAGWFGQPDPRLCELAASNQGPSARHVFGTDRQGCDVYANVVYGTRASLSIGVLSTAVAFVVALVLGTLAGYRGGWADTLVSRVTDVFLGFPFLLGAVVVLTAAGSRSPVVIALVLAAFLWPTLARLTRAGVRTVRDAPFVEAARAIGLGTGRIVGRYVLSNAIGPVLAVATTTVGGVIVAESTLTFLGLGLRAPSISWGLQLANAQATFQVAPHTLVFPGLFLVTTVLAIVTLGDLLRDCLDPKAR